MINFSKYDVVVVKFPFASSNKYKARPAVILSSETYNINTRGTLLIMAISSKINSALEFESHISHWQESGLLKPSIFKSAIATIEKEYVITKLGKLSPTDTKTIQTLIQKIC